MASVNFKVEIKVEKPTCYPPPVWSIDIPLALSVDSGVTEVSEISAIAVDGKCLGEKLWPHAWQAVHPDTVNSARPGQAMLRLPMTREMLSHVEPRRQGGGPVTVDLSLGISYIVIGQLTQQGTFTEQPKSRVMVAPTSCNWTIHRDPWRACLKELGWNEIELFELAAGLLLDDEKLAEALKCLRAAEACLRAGDTNGTLTRCYEAIESAAKHEAAGKKAKGFELLLERALPAPEYEGKRSSLNNWLRALSDLAQFGRHAGYPAVHVSYEEARFVLQGTLAFFAMTTQLIQTQK